MVNRKMVWIAMALVIAFCGAMFGLTSVVMYEYMSIICKFFF